MTLTARDASGHYAVDDVIVQTVHYALTANRPAMSSSIVASKTAPTGADRLWVVNQDNDSVSVFNATRTPAGA